MATHELEQRLLCVPRILGAFNRRSGTPLDADDLADLAQDTALIVLRKLEDYRALSAIEGWIYQVCSYEWRNAMRRKWRRSAQALAEHTLVDRTNLIDDFERREYVLHALEQIRVCDAETVRMHQIDGLTFVEIANRLKTTVNKIKGRYYRGIEQLNEILRETRKPGEEA